VKANDLNLIKVFENAILNGKMLLYENVGGV
jgi:hypothetical protein